VDARADLVILRIAATDADGDVVTPALTGSRSPANPWLGQRTAGRVERTFVAGRATYDRGRR